MVAYQSGRTELKTGWSETIVHPDFEHFDTGRKMIFHHGRSRRGLFCRRIYNFVALLPDR